MLFATAWMNLDSIRLTEISQLEKQKILYDFAHMWNLRNKINKGKKEQERQIKKQIVNYKEQTREARVAQWFSTAFSPGPDPGDLGSSPTSSSLHGACFFHCLWLCLTLSLCLS